MLLATSNYPDGVTCVASLAVQAHGSIRTQDFGDGRKAVRPLEAKYRSAGIHRLQELHEQFASSEVKAAENYDPTRVIHDFRRICAELVPLGNAAVSSSRKRHSLLKTLPDDHYFSFKTV